MNPHVYQEREEPFRDGGRFVRLRPGDIYVCLPCQEESDSESVFDLVDDFVTHTENCIHWIAEAKKRKKEWRNGRFIGSQDSDDSDDSSTEDSDADEMLQGRQDSDDSSQDSDDSSTADSDAGEMLHGDNEAAQN